MTALVCEACGAGLHATAMFCGECGTGVRRPGREAQPDGAATAVVELEPTAVPEPEPVSEAVPEPAPELEAVPEAAYGPDPVPVFTLQFSTGESVRVSGTGLIGRNPRPEPGELFDALVTIADPGRSVSKTHLEFGCSEGEFWVLDRFSGNGTVLQAPDAPARRCEPGLRIRVPRGSRVLIGEQSLLLS